MTQQLLDRPEGLRVLFHPRRESGWQRRSTAVHGAQYGPAGGYAPTMRQRLPRAERVSRLGSRFSGGSVGAR